MGHRPARRLPFAATGQVCDFSPDGGVEAIWAILATYWRNRMVRFVIAVVCLTLGAVASANAQPLLAFTGKDANAPDEFAFVALTDIPDGTVIFFTNYDFDNVSGTFGTAGLEGTIQFTVAGGDIPMWNVVRVHQVTNNTAGPYVVTNGGSSTAVHVAGEPVWAAVSADPHYAFAASNPAAPLTTVTNIYAYMDTDPDDASGSAKDPTGLYPDAVMLDFVGVQPVAADYTASRENVVVANFKNTANYTPGASIDLNLAAFNSLIFGDDFESGNTNAWSSVTP